MILNDMCIVDNSYVLCISDTKLMNSFITCQKDVLSVSLITVFFTYRVQCCA